MLVPLLARPVHHPLGNLLLQGWMTTMAALLAPFLVARYIAGATASASAVGALANTFLIIVGTPRLQFEWLIAQPYALSISLAIGGLLLAERAAAAAIVAGVALLLLAHWVSGIVFLFLLPIIMFRRQSIARSLMITAFASAGGLVWKQFATGTPTSLVIVEMSEWPTGWLHLLRTTSAWLVYPIWAIAIVGVAAAGLAHWASGRARESLTAAAVAGAAGLVYWLIVGTSEHVRANFYFPRYVFPALLLFSVALATVLVEPLLPHRRSARTMTVALMMTAALMVYGTPSVPRLHRELNRRFGAMTTDVLATGATVIAGDYWAVWPAVFHANLVLYERGGREGIYGLTYRSGPTEALWAGRRPLRVLLAAPPRTQGNIEPLFQRLGVPVSFVEHWPTLDLYLASSPTF
jgi:hypothetical protein